MLSNPAPWIYNVSYSPLSYPVPTHYTDVIISAKTSQITGVSMVCSAVCSGADQRKHQSSATLAFVRGIHRWFPSQRASNAENVFIWWRHHARNTSPQRLKYGKYLQVRRTSYFWALRSVQTVTCVLFQTKLYWIITYSVDFKAPQELYNPLGKTITGKFRRSSRQSKRKCLSDQVTFRRSRAWQFVSIV